MRFANLWEGPNERRSSPENGREAFVLFALGSHVGYTVVRRGSDPLALRKTLLRERRPNNGLGEVLQILMTLVIVGTVVALSMQ